MPTETLGAHFCLKNRDNFSISPREDARLYFGRQQLADSILREIKKSYKSGKPPKMLLWGDWGVGKTHTMFHIEYFLNDHQKDYPSAVYFVEFGNVLKKSRYSLLHEKMLDAIGKQKVNELLQKLMMSKAPTPLNQALSQYLDSSDMITAVTTLAVSPIQTPASSRAWKWLQGVELPANELEELDISRNLTDSIDLVNTLKFIGQLFFEMEKKYLVLLLDEARKLENVKEEDAETGWLDAFKELSDDRNRHVGFVITGSFREEEDFPEVLGDEQVITRLGKDRVVPLHNFEPPDAKRFFEDLLESLIDKDCLKARGIDPKKLPHYPFENEAFETFVKSVSRDIEKSVPRVMLQKIDNIAFEALEKGKDTIDADLLTSLEIS